eukprot:TRINITY_DN21828_c0_g1_i2.p1 TRINITY_DN21828_c0_g1~~TRINITY_DN21828_c0_g1_i2.p1  ORF type:complete len:159 (-),score=48.68 TRINITY_DN21828_c0_g1_i2:94-570(-)
MIRRPPRSTQGVSSAASDVYKRQVSTQSTWELMNEINELKKTGLVKGEHLTPGSGKKILMIIFKIRSEYKIKTQKRTQKERVTFVNDTTSKKYLELLKETIHLIKESIEKSRELALGFLGVSGKIYSEYESSKEYETCLLYTSPSPRDLSTSRMPSSA